MLRKIREILFGSNLIRSVKRSIKETRGEKYSKINEIYDDILDYFWNLYTNLIIVPTETIEKFFFWGWKLKKSHDFDRYYFYEITHLKLDRMYKCFRDHSHLMWDSDINTKGMRKLRICRELAKRLWEDDYNQNMNKHDLIWGDSSSIRKKENGKTYIEFVRKNVTDKKSKEQEGKEFMLARKLDENQRDYERKYFYDLLYKQLDGFWD